MKALRAYRAAKEELIEAIAEAEAAGCSDEAEELRDDLKFIAAELAKNTGRRGKSRTFADDDGSRQTRSGVTNAITRALKQIADCSQLEPTAAFLKRHIEKGCVCVYHPDPSARRWHVEK